MFRRLPARLRATLAAALTLACALALAAVGTVRCSGARQASLVFAVVGDSQGRAEVWTRVISAVNAARPAFLIHCGDMTPSGTDEQYRDFVEQARSLRMPWHAVPGNHDVRSGGAERFTRFTGKARYYSFVEKGYRFIGLDTSSGAVDPEQLAWLERELDQSGPKFVFMHIPLLDPRPGEDHCLLDSDQASTLHESFRQHGVLAVFSGHVHMFAREERDGVTYVTTGGAGALLHAAPSDGGFFHYTLVRVDGTKLDVQPKPVKVEIEEPRVVVVGPKGKKELSIGALALLPSVEVRAGFENQFGNVRGEGTYVGVPVATLLDVVGGIKPGQTLTVVCSDGYTQDFGYENVHPSAEWTRFQGQMVLAYEMDGMVPPDWTEGPRLVMAPADGVYSNDDCARTSLPGQGWNVYKSAGGRWARNVSRIEVK